MDDEWMKCFSERITTYIVFLIWINQDKWLQPDHRRCFPVVALQKLGDQDIRVKGWIPHHLSHHLCSAPA